MVSDFSSLPLRTIGDKPSGETVFHRLLGWLFLFLIPFVVFRLSVFHLISEQEKDLEERMKETLFQEIRAFSQDLLPERQLEASLSRVEKELGWPNSSHSGVFRFQPGADLPFSSQDIQRSLQKHLLKDLQAQPLLVATVGPDGGDLKIWTNPKAYSSTAPPGRKAVLEIMKFQGKLEEREIWKAGPGNRTPTSAHSETSKRDSERRKKSFERFARSLFGPFAVVSENSDGCTSFLTTKFGGDRIFSRYRYLNAAPGAASPVIGGYWVCFLESAFSRGHLEKFALKASSHPEIFRGFAFSQGVNRRYFRKTRNWFACLAPLPQEHLFRGIHRKRDIARRLVRGARTGEKPANPLISARIRVEALRHPWRRIAEQGGLALVIVGMFLLVACFRGFPGENRFPLNIRGKILLVLALAVFLPCCLLGILLRTYFLFLDERDIRYQLRTMKENLGMLEDAVSAHASEVQATFFSLRERLRHVIDSSPKELEMVFSRVIETGTVSHGHLFRSDGFTLNVFAKPANMPHVDIRASEKHTNLGLAYGIKLFSLIPGMAEPFRRLVLTLPEGKFSLAIADVMGHSDTNSLLCETGARKLVNIAQLDDRWTSLFFVPSLTMKVRAILVILEPFSAVAFSALSHLQKKPGFFEQLDQRFHTRLFFFQLKSQKNPTLLADTCFPQGARPDDWALEKTRLFLHQNEEGAARVGDHLITIRRFDQFPVVAVAVCRILNPDLADLRSGIVLGVLAVLSFALLGLLATLLAEVFAHPITLLLQASREVREGNLNSRVEAAGADEFGLLGREFNAMVTGLKERRELERFVSAEVSSGIRELSLAGERLSGRRVRRTILFSHIRNFDRILDTLAPEEVVGLLNDFFTRMEEIISRDGGIIDKFIGDAVMATFPEEETGAEKAVGCAMAMQKEMAGFPPRGSLAPENELEIGVGIATGWVISGQVGSRSGRQDFTVIGDTVNLAARLEALARKSTPSIILLDENTQQALSPDFPVLFFGEVTVKGKELPIKAFQAGQILKPGGSV